jgi:hypothetical protein
MKRFMVRYTVKPDRAEENVSYIAAVFRQLEKERPDSVRYAVFRLDDGVSFIHLVAIDGEGNALRELSAFQAFLDGIIDRCAVPPETIPLQVLETYRVYGDQEEAR